VKREPRPSSLTYLIAELDDEIKAVIPKVAELLLDSSESLQKEAIGAMADFTKRGADKEW
jgi:hypothetical protein